MRTSLVLSLHALRSMYDGYRNRIVWIITLHVSHTQWCNHLLLLLLLCHLIQCQRGSGWLQIVRSFTFSPHLLLHRTLRINTSPRSYRRHYSLLLLLQRPCLIHRSGRSRRAHVAGNTSFRLFKEYSFLHNLVCFHIYNKHSTSASLIKQFRWRQAPP